MKPKQGVIELYPLLEQLQTDLSSASTCEYIFDDLVAEAFMAAANQNPTAITTFADRVFDQFSRHEGLFTGEVVSKALLKFAFGLHLMFTEREFWNSEGQLDYYFKRILGSSILVEAYQ